MAEPQVSCLGRVPESRLRFGNDIFQQRNVPVSRRQVDGIGIIVERLPEIRILIGSDQFVEKRLGLEIVIITQQ